MIRAVRRTRLARQLAILALAALVALTVSSPLHDYRDDPLCNAATALGDDSAPQLTAAAPSYSHPEHCVLCHALQSMRADVPLARFGPPPCDARLFATRPRPVFAALFVSATPARAPPAA